VKAISFRTQLNLVWAGYGLVLAASIGLVFLRYLQYVLHPQDADQYSGMWAGGDMILGIFIGGLFLIPTFFLLLVIAQSEAASTLYAKVVLGLSITLPLSVGTMLIPAVSQSWILGSPGFFRVMESPMVLVGLVISRLMVRFPRAKRLTSYALMVEFGTLFLMGAAMSSGKVG